jgi:hypothetical protein
VFTWFLTIDALQVHQQGNEGKGKRRRRGTRARTRGANCACEDDQSGKCTTPLLPTDSKHTHGQKRELQMTAATSKTHTAVCEPNVSQRKTGVQRCMQIRGVRQRGQAGTYRQVSTSRVGMLNDTGAQLDITPTLVTLQKARPRQLTCVPLSRGCRECRGVW